MREKTGESLNTGDLCELCRSKNQVLRHKHLVEFRGDLADHLKTNLPNGADSDKDSARERQIERILDWAKHMRDTYGGQVGEVGNMLTPWEARQQAFSGYANKYFKKQKQPISLAGQKIVFATFKAMLTGSRSQHAKIWLEYVGNQFPNGVIEGNWKEFLNFMRAFYKSASDIENVELMQDVVDATVSRITNRDRM